MSSAAASDKHVLELAAEVADQEVLATFREVTSAVAASYPELRLQHPRLTVRDFKLMLRVGLLELFAADEFPTTQARANRLNYSKIDIQQLCQEDAYPRVCEALRCAFEDLARPKDYRAHLEDIKTQDRMFREHKRIALSSRDEREKQRALATFADRYAPVIKTSNQTNVVVIQGQDILELDKLERRLEGAGHTITLDAHPAVHAGSPPSDPGEG